MKNYILLLSKALFSNPTRRNGTKTPTYLKCAGLPTDKMCKKANIFCFAYIWVSMFQDRWKAELMP